MKLHLGCGRINIPGYINVDLSDLPHIHHISDISDLSFIEDQSVDLIYVSATFQYFDRKEGEGCLREWYRVLRDGGCLQISTVDFDKLLEVYAKSGKLESIIGPLYGRMGVYDSGGNCLSYIYHKSVYNKPDFIKMLEKVGFKNIQEYDYRDTIHAKYDDQSQSFYPHMDKENGIHIMQNFKSFKQGGCG